MDGTSRQSNSGRTWEVAGTWGGEGGRGLPFFFWWKGENGMGETRWARATESYRSLVPPEAQKRGCCPSEARAAHCK